ncbi:uncharacterized protein LOC131937836 [Physella acuta]|uniref:uncharacterized protein LOC131937836 n=1 Tax=Physella acuta TaxID=109671 RepID=UPI0027DBAA1F|nr:uncharacterized protein LOC131937836 [Physella acuta]
MEVCYSCEEIVKNSSVLAVNSRTADQQLISDDVRRTVEMVLYVVVNFIVGVSLSTSVNVSLLSLSVADLVSLVFLTWESVCYNPSLASPEIPLVAIHYYTATIPRSICVRIAWWITTFITFERCLCISLPLHVRDVLTPRRTLLILTLIALVHIAGMSPFWFSRQVFTVFIAGKNSSQYRARYSPNGAYIENIGYNFSVVSQFVTYILDLGCACFTIQQLHVKSRWRKRNSTTSALTPANRDVKVTRMVALLSSLFLAFTLPNCVSFVLVISKTPGYVVEQNTFLMVRACILTIESIGSSVNILVYYSMSSRYRKIFNSFMSRPD